MKFKSLKLIAISFSLISLSGVFGLPIAQAETSETVHECVCEFITGASTEPIRKLFTGSEWVAESVSPSADICETFCITYASNLPAATTLASSTHTKYETDKFTPVVPRLGVDIGLEFSTPTKEGEKLSINFIGEYITAVYSWLIGIAVVFAVVIVIVGGIQYMVSGGSKQGVTELKKRIGNALIGLVLLLGSYVILYTTNPQLTFFEPLRVDYVAFVELPLEEQADLAVDPNVEKLCDNIESCKDWCTLTSDGTDQAALEGELPSLATNGMASPDELVSISGINGLETSHSGHLILPAVLDMLKSAATAARAEGVTLYVVSSYRPLLQQLKLACDEIRAADTAGRTPKIPTAIAWPGSSAHGTGSAVDIKYKDAQGNLSWNVKYSTQSSADPDNVALLAKIMYSAGWHRYVKEIWHFQAYSGTCTSQSCTVATTSCSCN